jgi:hypothetical protein
MRAVILMVAMLALAGCATPVPVDKPCGVITDSLRDVHAMTPKGETRLIIHFERGVAAGCWGRT